MSRRPRVASRFAVVVTGRGESEAQLVLPHARSPDALLLLAHGAGAGHSHPFFVELTAALADEGLAVVTFDFLYMHGGRRLPDKLPVLVETMAAARAAVDARADLASLPLVLSGKSMGGRVATHVAVERPGRERAVVALAYPLAPPKAARPVDRVAHLTALPVPLLVLQGSRDAFGGPDRVRSAFSAVPHVRVREVAGADHSFARPKRLEAPAVHLELARAVRELLESEGVVS